MRYLFILGASVLIIASSVGIIIATRGPSAREIAYQKSILVVLDHNRTLYRSDFTEARHRLPPARLRMLHRRFVQDIGQIDVSKCPKDFQVAWVDYIAAWRHCEDRPSAILPMTELIVGTVYAASGGLKVAAHGGTQLLVQGEEAKQARSEVDDAFSACQKVAIAHGIVFHPTS